MIWEVDTSLESLLRAEALRDTETDVVFDAPTTDWAARLTGPVVDAFLYDIHEDVERRHAGVAPEKNAQGRITGRRPPIRYYKLSYLITAWTTRAVGRAPAARAAVGESDSLRLDSGRAPARPAAEPVDLADHGNPAAGPQRV